MINMQKCPFLPYNAWLINEGTLTILIVQEALEVTGIGGASDGSGHVIIIQGSPRQPASLHFGLAVSVNREKNTMRIIILHHIYNSDHNF